MRRIQRRRRLAAAVATFASILLTGMVVPTTATAAPGEPPLPIAPNPELQAGCGIDIQMILDESGSVANFAGNVRSAFRAFTSAVRNTGSTLAVSEFSDVARLPLPGAANRAYTPVTDATVRDIFEPYIATGYQPGGRTNWEDPFRVDRYLLPRPSLSRPYLVVFITDGDPNQVVNYNQVTYSPGNANPALNEYETKVPLAGSEVTSTDENFAKDRAVPNANAIKQTGGHVLAVAVGQGLTSPASLERLKAVSGPDVYSGTGAFDGHYDVYRVPDFAQLEAALRQAAFALCAPSVTVRKLVDYTPDPGPDDSIPGDGWGMTAAVVAGARLLGAAGGRDWRHRRHDHGWQWLRQLPMDHGHHGHPDDDRHGAAALRHASGDRERPVVLELCVPHTGSTARPGSGRHAERQRVHGRHPQPGHRHLPDGEPSHASAVGRVEEVHQRRRRRHPTGPVHPDDHRRHADSHHVDLPGHQHRQRHADGNRGHGRPWGGRDVPEERAGASRGDDVHRAGRRR